MTTNVTSEEKPSISSEQLARLFTELQAWSDDMDPFRYERFARRLVAAEYGRPDAVEWALNWHRQLVEEERAQLAAQEQAARRFEQQAAAIRAELQAGHAPGNPRYQAYLDTLEHPERDGSNTGFFSWMAPLIAANNRHPGYAGWSQEQRMEHLDQLVRQAREANLAPRLRNAALTEH